MSLKTIIYCIAILLPSLSTAQLLPGGPDIVPTFGESFEIKDGQLTFELVLENRGTSMLEERTLFSKILMVPKTNYKEKLVDQGLVLSTLETTLFLESSESKRIVVTKALPSVEMGEYFLAVTINTTLFWSPTDFIGGGVIIGENDRGDTIEEGFGNRNEPDPNRPSYVREPIGAQLNNITEVMLDLGVVSHSKENSNSGKYDLYHEISSAHFDVRDNTATHSSRNILRVMNGSDEVPLEEHWNDDISARFCFFNLQEGRAYLGSYNRNALDKVWGAIRWSPELDTSGRNIYVDYYSNRPTVDHLAPAEYVVGILMNVNDKFKLDSFPENNLDLTFLDLKEKSLMSSPDEVWFPVGQSNQNIIQASIGGRSDEHTWSYNIESPPEWMDIIETNNDYSYSLVVEVTDEMPIGAFEYPINITATDKDGLTFNKTTVLRVYKNDGPILKLRDLEQGSVINSNHPSVEINEENGLKTLQFEFQIENTGNRDLLFDAGRVWPSGVQLELPATRIVAPGQAVTVLLKIKLIGVLIPRPGGQSIFHVNIDLQTNAPNGNFQLNFDLSGI